LPTEYFNVYSPLSRNLLPRVRIVEPGATTSTVDIVHRQIDNQSLSPPEAIAAGQQIRKIMEKKRKEGKKVKKKKKKKEDDDYLLANRSLLEWVSGDFAGRPSRVHAPGHYSL
jgi:hypothetical protein